MRKGSTWVKLGVFLAVIAGVWAGLAALGIDLTQLTPSRVRTFVLSFGVWAPLVYLAVYGQPVVPLPASVMTITGGLAFGPFWGTLAALGGATTRACGQFAIVKLFGREAIEKLLKGKLASLNQQVGRHGFKAVLLVRLIPNFPFDVQNYALGFTRVRLLPFALATFLGMIPGSFAFVYLGYSLTDLRNAWKILVAFLLIIALIAGQRWYVKRRKPPG